MLTKYLNHFQNKNDEELRNLMANNNIIKINTIMWKTKQERVIEIRQCAFSWIEDIEDRNTVKIGN